MVDKKKSRGRGLWPDTIEEMVECGVAHFAFERLAQAESPQEYQSICASIVRRARHLDQDQLNAFAATVELGFPKRPAKKPSLNKRNRAIRIALLVSTDMGGLRGLGRNEAIERISQQYDMKRPAAKAAFNKALTELDADGWSASSFWPTEDRKKPRT